MNENRGKRGRRHGEWRNEGKGGGEGGGRRYLTAFEFFFELLTDFIETITDGRNSVKAVDDFHTMTLVQYVDVTT